MGPDDRFWEDVERLFAEVVELGPPDRADFLDRHCGGHPQLRTEIESLIAAHTAAGGFLDGVTRGAPAPEVQADRFAGRTIGQFRLLEKIGEGGMDI